MNPCTRPACDEPRHGHGLCRVHYGEVYAPPSGRPRARIDLDVVVDLLDAGVHPARVADRLGVAVLSIARAAQRRGRYDLARRITSGEPMTSRRRSLTERPTVDERRERAHLELVHHPDYESRECADEWRLWDGPGDGQTVVDWWTQRGSFAAALCRSCPVFLSCDAWRRAGADVTGVLAGQPVENGRVLDVSRRRGAKGVAA